jgi:hypothetical protein
LANQVSGQHDRGSVALKPEPQGPTAKPESAFKRKVWPAGRTGRQDPGPEHVPPPAPRGHEQ